MIPYIHYRYGHIGKRPKKIKFWAAMIYLLIRQIAKKFANGNFAIDFRMYPRIEKEDMRQNAGRIHCRVL